MESKTIFFGLGKEMPNNKYIMLPEGEGKSFLPTSLNIDELTLYLEEWRLKETTKRKNLFFIGDFNYLWNAEKELFFKKNFAYLPARSDFVRVPLVFVNVTLKHLESPSHIYSAIINGFFGIHTLNEQSDLNYVKLLIKRCQTQIILFENIESILRLPLPSKRKIIDAIQKIVNEFSVGLVVLGSIESHELLSETIPFECLKLPKLLMRTVIFMEGEVDEIVDIFETKESAMIDLEKLGFGFYGQEQCLCPRTLSWVPIKGDSNLYLN